MSKRAANYLLLSFIFSLLLPLSVFRLFAQSYQSDKNNAPVNHTSKTTLIGQNEEAPILGEPCGSGALLPEWVICLHGVIGEVSPLGEITPFDDILVTISYQEKTVSGTTFIHPGKTIPTYGIDISSLKPQFLQPVTVTVVFPQTSIERQIVIFPDFQTQNQQADILIPTVSALDSAPLWGHVIDFQSEGAVEGAVVTVQHNSQIITQTTELNAEETEYIYQFEQADLASINAFSGDTVTVTASFNNDIDLQTVQLSSDPLQLDFVTGWKCDDFDPLPRESVGVGLPRESVGVGLPDVACFWGYGLVDGVPQEEVTVQIVVSDTVYEAETRLFPGELVPRYAIGAWGGSQLDGEVVEGTAVYKGQTSPIQFEVDLDESSHMQNHVFLSGIEVLFNQMNINDVHAMTWLNDTLWSGSFGGLVKWDVDQNTYEQFQVFDGLAGNGIKTISKDDAGNLWVGTFGNGISMLSSTTMEWRTFNSANSNLINDVVTASGIDQEGKIWFGTHAGIMSYDAENDIWETKLTLNDAPLHIKGPHYWTSTVTHSDGGIWFSATDNLLRRYDPVQDNWITIELPVVEGLENGARELLFEGESSLWVGTTHGGLVHFDLNTYLFTVYDTSNSGIIGNYVDALILDEDNNMWLGTKSGISFFNLSENSWQSFTTSNTNLTDNWIKNVLIDPDKNIWFGTENGINRFSPQTETWDSFIEEGTNSLYNNHIHEIAFDQNNNLIVGYNTKGLSIFTPETNNWEFYNSENSFLPSDRIRGIEVVGDDIWLVAAKKLIQFNPIANVWKIYAPNNSGILDSAIEEMVLAQENHIWIAQQDGVSVFNLQNETWETFTTENSGLLHNHIWAIATDSKGTIWMGDNGGNLTAYSPATESWQVFNKENSSMPNSSPPREIAVDLDDTLWIGNNHLNHFNPISGEWLKYTSNEIGFVDSGLTKSIFIDRNGDLWLSYFPEEDSENRFINDGILYLPKGQDNWRFYSKSELGLSTSVHFAFAEDNSGNVWVGSGGLANFHTLTRQSDLHLQVEGPEAVVPSSEILFDIMVKNQGQSGTDSVISLTISPELNNVSFSQPPTKTNPWVWEIDDLEPDDSDQIIQVTAVLPENATPGNSYIISATAASTTTPESFLGNNTSQIAIEVLDPYKSDVRVTMSGPPVLVPGNTAVIDVWIDNFGGLDAENSVLNLTLPQELSFGFAEPQPTSQLEWQLDTIEAFSEPIHIEITSNVATDLPNGSELSISAQLSTTTEESDVLNNTAVVHVQSSISDAETLILVAPARLSSRFGASPILDKLYEVAEHPQVNGVVLDVMRDVEVALAYEVWDANSLSWQAANDVAIEIKALIDEYTLAYPNLRYLMIVGGDDVIPFYRVSDQNGTSWQERTYAAYVPVSPLQAALSANKLLTDDYYGDRTATTPESPFWLDGHPLYLPDFATGRLVETPEEMIASIDAFLANNGVIEFENHLINYLPSLTEDLGLSQCDIFEADGMSANCPPGQDAFVDEALENPYTGLWSAPHANHLSIGSLSAIEVANSSLNHAETLMVSIGCHAGLNVGDVSSSTLPFLDMAQAFLGKGGTYVASTSYTYATYLSTGYSEALALALSEHLIEGEQQSLGYALVHAKQHYYSTRANWIDYTDEKILIPMTLYGFPMLEVKTPHTANLQSTGEDDFTTFRQKASFDGTAVTYQFNNLQTTRIQTELGDYFTYQEESIAQEGTPVQPYFQTEIPTQENSNIARGIVLRSAEYSIYPNFDPVIAQSWALDLEQSPQFTEAAPLFSDWDRQWPYELAQFDGLSNDLTNLNLVLGQFDLSSHQERIFSDLTVEVTYSDSSDTISPSMTGLVSNIENGLLSISLTALDEGGINEVNAVCDDMNGHWETAVFKHNNGRWQGYCEAGTGQFFIQIIDQSGNVLRSDWYPPLNQTNIFLPLITTP